MKIKKIYSIIYFCQNGQEFIDWMIEILKLSIKTGKTIENIV